jgi:2',3'-cyclic-nucleotide 2'-phosphodiesterase (5'-nucleotidase family)
MATQSPRLDHVAFTERLQNLFDAITKFRGRIVCAVVHLNDTYLLDEQESRSLPGFPRLIATIGALREHVVDQMGEDRLVVVHSGDFLGPSRLGNADQGTAMIDMLNRSQLRYFVPGNHEFDYGPLQFEFQLLARVRSHLVCCNVTPPSTIKRASGFSPWPHEQSPQVAFTGVVSKDVHKSFGEDWKFTDANQALEAFSRNTSMIPFHVVLSHATREEDRAMRPALEDCARTVLLGGHDHHIGWPEDDDRPILYKNRSNLHSVRRCASAR